MRVKTHLKSSVLEQDTGTLEALSCALWLQPASDLHVESGKKTTKTTTTTNFSVRVYGSIITVCYFPRLSATMIRLTLYDMVSIPQ